MTVAIVVALAVLVVGLIPLVVVLLRSDRVPDESTPATASRPPRIRTPDAQEERERAFREQRESVSPETRLVTSGIIASVLFPLAGIVIGIVLLFKERVGPGLGCILLSVLVMLTTYVLVFA